MNALHSMVAASSHVQTRWEASPVDVGLDTYWTIMGGPAQVRASIYIIQILILDETLQL